MKTSGHRCVPSGLKVRSFRSRRRAEADTGNAHDSLPTRCAGFVPGASRRLPQVCQKLLFAWTGPAVVDASKAGDGATRIPARFGFQFNPNSGPDHERREKHEKGKGVASKETEPNHFISTGFPSLLISCLAWFLLRRSGSEQPKPFHARLGAHAPDGSCHSQPSSADAVCRSSNCFRALCSRLITTCAMRFINS